MSVLKNKRTESKAEFVNTANDIYAETLAFVTRLTTRYARIMAADIVSLAGEVLDNAEKANKVFPSDEERIVIRKEFLLNALASLSALDVRLTHCYVAMSKNPYGCFTNAKGQDDSKDKAIKRLDSMSYKLGNLIDKEDALLKAVLVSDTRRRKNL